MTSKINKLLAIVFLSLIPTLLIWLPFIARTGSFWGIPLPTDGMATVVSNYDGPLYLVVAKTLYSPNLIKQFAFLLPVEYYAAHFPMYPILIKLFAGILGFPYSMLFVSMLTSILALYFFYLLISDFVEKKDIMWMTFIFSIFPARWLIVRSVGSAEPLFIAGIIASIYYFRKEKYLWAGIWGAVAQMTKSPGILLFVAYFFAITLPNLKNILTLGNFKLVRIFNLKKYWGIVLIPLSILPVFYIYKVQLNDFWAYFHSGDNIHLFFPPFQIFNFSKPWVGTFWLEEIIFVYLLAAYGISKLIEMKETVLVWFSMIFFTMILFVSHRDVLRYALPIVPFLMVGYSKVLVKKETKIIIAILLIPIYLFSLGYISQNVMPISDWAPLL